MIDLTRSSTVSFRVLDGPWCCSSRISFWGSRPVILFSFCKDMAAGSFCKLDEGATWFEINFNTIAKEIIESVGFCILKHREQLMNETRGRLRKPREGLGGKHWSRHRDSIDHQYVFTSAYNRSGDLHMRMCSSTLESIRSRGSRR